MQKKIKFKPKITRIRLNPDQAVLSCSCWQGYWFNFDGSPGHNYGYASPTQTGFLACTRGDKTGANVVEVTRGTGIIYGGRSSANS